MDREMAASIREAREALGFSEAQPRMLSWHQRTMDAPTTGVKTSPETSCRTMPRCRVQTTLGVYPTCKDSPAHGAKPGLGAQ